MNQYSRGAVGSYVSFVGSCLLIETPRGISHCLLCLAATYAIHDLNPNPTNVTFCVLCLMVRCFAVEDVRFRFSKIRRQKDTKTER